MTLLDVDDLATWPPHVVAEADAWARQLKGTTEATGELDVPDSAFPNLISDHLFLAYHCTRLLLHEIEDVRSNGLRIANPDTTLLRIARAAENGYLTPEQRSLLDRGNCFTDANLPPFVRDSRPAQVCLFLGRRGFKDGCHYLVGEWGGEVIARFAAEGCPAVLKLGTPTVIRASVDLRWPLRVDPFIRKLLVGIRLNLDDAYRAVHFADSIPATHVIGMWHPQDAEYRDLPGDLPRE